MTNNNNAVTLHYSPVGMVVTDWPSFNLYKIAKSIIEKSEEKQQKKRKIKHRKQKICIHLDDECNNNQN